MYKKTITYTDYNGKKRTEDKYFNMTEPEAMKLQYSVEGGYAAKLEEIKKNEDQGAALDFLEDILLRSYGEKTEDGGFEKSAEITRRFKNSAAYPAIFMELATDTKAVEEFINATFPKPKNAQTGDDLVPIPKTKGKK